MKKTQLGISIPMAAGCMYLLCLFGSFIPSLLFAGYILLFEENSWLKRCAVNSLALLFGFSVLRNATHLLPYFIDVIDSFVRLFGGSCTAAVIDNIAYLIYDILDIAAIVTFLLGGYMAFKGKSIHLPFIDKFVKRHLKEED